MMYHVTWRSRHRRVLSPSCRQDGLVWRLAGDSREPSHVSDRRCPLRHTPHTAWCENDTRTARNRYTWTCYRPTTHNSLFLCLSPQSVTHTCILKPMTHRGFLRKSLAQETFPGKLAQVTCESSAWHTWKSNNESCRLKVAFRGRYCVLILTGQSQLTVYERKLSG